MPIKICKNCNAENHVRRLACIKCGVAFQHKSKKTKEVKIDESITVGNWAKDIPKGMPKIEIPEPLNPTDILDNDTIRNYIAEEGIGYCILTLINENQIKNEELKKIWIETKEKMKQIIQIVYS